MEIMVVNTWLSRKQKNGKIIKAKKIGSKVIS